jgi:2-oxoglutarate ferredoxin oxidoreductase subunit delta
MPRIDIDEDRCKGCELCTIPCPHELVKMSERFNHKGYRTTEQVDPGGQCTGCAMCARMCPDVVITVYR